MGAEWIREANCRSSLLALEVVERKGNENDVTSGH